jgi:hypothetical protein
LHQTRTCNGVVRRRCLRSRAHSPASAGPSDGGRSVAERRKKNPKRGRARGNQESSGIVILGSDTDEFNPASVKSISSRPFYTGMFEHRM